jgi:hypothetical protein
LVCRHCGSDGLSPSLNLTGKAGAAALGYDLSALLSPRRDLRHLLWRGKPVYPGAASLRRKDSRRVPRRSTRRDLGEPSGRSNRPVCGMPCRRYVGEGARHFLSGARADYASAVEFQNRDRGFPIDTRSPGLGCASPRSADYRHSLDFDHFADDVHPTCLPSAPR